MKLFSLFKPHRMTIISETSGVHNCLILQTKMKLFLCRLLPGGRLLSIFRVWLIYYYLFSRSHAKSSWWMIHMRQKLTNTHPTSWNRDEDDFPACEKNQSLFTNPIQNSVENLLEMNRIITIFFSNTYIFDTHHFFSKVWAEFQFNTHLSPSY